MQVERPFAFIFVGMCAVFGASTAHAQMMAAVDELKQMSFDQLLDMEVTSVSRKSEQLRAAPAAVTVVTNEDIRRSGATTLPETLRLIPGLHVAQTTANTWAISSRGFSSVNSEKLLVLTDSRSIYTPLYSGVFWDVQDYLLQDIDRIEVIRGPGATQWGSNAVNGVINIQTKSARDTLGSYVEAGTGDELNTLVGARYGGKFAEDGYFRVFGKYVDYDDAYNPTAQSNDDWHMGHFGARADWDASERDVITVQGGAYRGTVGQPVPSIQVGARPGPQGTLATDLRGAHVLTRWQRSLDDGAGMQLLAYYDHTRRDDPSFDDRLDTIDIDFQHRFHWLTRHDIVWGLNYRHMANRNEGKVIFALDPESSHDELFSAFVQDEIAVTDAVRFTFGSKVEHNDFSGLEVQPSVRAAWTITPEHTLWAAASRAVRVPTRIERDLAVDVNPGSNPLLRLAGNEHFDAEELVAYELGHRWQLHEKVLIDTSLFYNDYEGLASLEPGAPFVEAGRVIVPIQYDNATDGDARGIELQVTAAPLASWRLTGSYSYVDVDLDPHGLDLNRGRFLAGSTPHHQFGLRSIVDLPRGLQLDTYWRHLSDIGHVPAIASGVGVDGYSELDVRMAWRGWREIEVAVVGRNLLHKRHAEFGPEPITAEIERNVYAKVSWGF